MKINFVREGPRVANITSAINFDPKRVVNLFSLELAAFMIKWNKLRIASYK